MHGRRTRNRSRLQRQRRQRSALDAKARPDATGSARLSEETKQPSIELVELRVDEEPRQNGRDDTSVKTSAIVVASSAAPNQAAADAKTDVDLTSEKTRRHIADPDGPPEPSPSGNTNEYIRWWIRWHIVTRTWFENTILVLIILNCTLIAFSNPRLSPSHWSNRLSSETELAFNLVFLIEMLLKMYALGLGFATSSKATHAHRPPAYFRDGWNYIDFITVVAGFLGLIPSFANFQFIRVIRVLRPLRAVKRIEPLQLVVNTLVAALTGMGGVALLLLFLFLVASILGRELFAGVLHQRCYDDTTFALVDEDYVPPHSNASVPNSFDLSRICTLSGGTGLFDCKGAGINATCRREGPNRHSGVGSWDNTLDACYQVFQVRRIFIYIFLIFR